MTDTKENWFSEVGWKANPFTLEIDPSLLVGYSKELNRIHEHINEGHKNILITGPTGAGKTTIMKHVSDEYECFYIPKPPKDEKDLALVFENSVLKPSVIQRLFGKRELNVYNLAEKFNKKMKGKKYVLLIDEAHETSRNVLEWLRTLTDQMKGTTLVLAALPKIKKEQLKELETLNQRITLDIELLALNKNETRELIKKRIAYVNGSNLEPFTLDIISEIYERTAGFPREILKMCNTLVHEAIKKDVTIIDRDLISGDVHVNVVSKMNNILEDLTAKQKAIVELLSHERLSPSQIIKKMNSDDYKSKAHALRATNNILKRLFNTGVLTRERTGKTYMYSVSSRIKSMLVEN